VRNTRGSATAKEDELGLARASELSRSDPELQPVGDDWPKRASRPAHVQRPLVHSFKVSLYDGTPVLLRPVTPDDKPLFERGMSELSAASRQKRFLSSVERLNEEQLRYLTEIDYVNHVAWGAVDARQPLRRGLGVARYIRLEEDPMAAEMAVTVIDNFQGKGLGTLLLVVLAASATANGIESFFAHVGGGNTALLRMVTELGGRVRAVESGLVKVKVPLPRDPVDLPDTASGRQFKKADLQLRRNFESSRRWK